MDPNKNKTKEPTNTGESFESELDQIFSRQGGTDEEEEKAEKAEPAQPPKPES